MHTKPWFIEAYTKSVKSLDTEEKLDLYFYRPLGFAVALAGQALRLTPSHLTLLGSSMGVIAGWLYYHNTSLECLVAGTALFLISGIFDSADGQLARMANQNTRMGQILDGMCDTVVFGTIYFFSILLFLPSYGWAFLWVGVVAGLSHSFQSAILDFYNREYLYFGYAKTDEGDYWNPSLSEAREEIEKSTTFRERFFNRARYNWLFQQYAATTRKDDFRAAMKDWTLGPRSQAFQLAYRENNRNCLRFWSLMGPNFHTFSIILFVFLRRFDLYLLLVDILFLNIMMLCLYQLQKRADERLKKWMVQNFAASSLPS